MKLRFISLLPRPRGRNGVSRILTWPNGVWSRAGWARKNWPATVFGLALMTSLLTPNAGRAAVMFNATSLPGTEYIQFGVDHFLGRTVWVSALTEQGEITHFSGLRKDGWNIVTFDPLTHSSLGPLRVLQVGNGRNFLTDAGDVVDVENVVINAGKESVLQLETFLPGIDVNFGPAPDFRAVIRLAGYGDFALLNGPILASDGNIRGFEMTMGFNDSTRVSSSTRSLLTLPGGALKGYSGGFLENPTTGEAFGRANEASLTTNELQTVFFVPYDVAFISQNLKVVPEPTSESLLAVGAFRWIAIQAASSPHVSPLVTKLRLVTP